MIHEFTFEHMMSLYSGYISNKHRDTWGLNADVKNEGEEYQKGALCYIKTHFGKWVGKLLYDKCVDAGFPGLKMLDIDPESDDYEHYEEEFTCPMEDSTVAPFQLTEWCGDYYIIKLYNNDEIGKFLMLLGQILHEYGVDSEMHQERGLVEPHNRDAMFRAMVVENIIGELYPIVEDACRLGFDSE